MRENITVTVLMTVYNGGHYLKMAVESVLAQTYKDFEFLIIDDCGTDDSLTVVKSFDDKRIVIHCNEQNLGQTRSLNVGLKLARGKYVARIDADDIALPHWLERQVSAAIENPGDAVISTPAIVIDASNKIKKVSGSPATLEEIILRSLTFSPINHVGSLLKKEIILDNGGYDENYKTAADYNLWGKLLRNSVGISSTRDVLMAIRVHAASLTITEIDKSGLTEISSIMKKNIDYFTCSGIKEDEADLVCGALYQEKVLSDGEFDQAIKVLTRVYSDLSLPGIASKDIINKWLKARRTTAYLKRIYYFITQKNYAASRRLSWKGVIVFGPLSAFTILWGVSLLGGMALSHIPGFYNKILKRKACLQLGIQPNMGIMRVQIKRCLSTTKLF